MRSNEKNRKKRIAHVSTSDLTIKYLLRNQLNSFVELGYEVHAISAKGEFFCDLKNESYNYTSLPIFRRISPFLDCYSLVRLTSYFRKTKFDLVHTHTNKAGILGCWAAALAGVKNILTTIHGFYFHEFMHPAARLFFVNLYKFTLSFAKRVFVQSKEDIETAICLGIVPRRKLVHIGNGIDLRRFDPSNELIESEARLLRIRNEIPLDSHLIGIISRINSEKGIKELILAVYNLIREKNLNLHLAVIGGGPSYNKYKQLSSSLGLANYIHFVGFQGNIPAWLMAMDIFVLPSYREGFPRTICEAFAMARPVIATNIRGCRELITPDETGILIPPKDVDSLIMAIDGLLWNESHRKEMGKKARDYARRFLDENFVIRKIHQTYRELGIYGSPEERQYTEGASAPRVENYEVAR